MVTKLRFMNMKISCVFIISLTLLPLLSFCDSNSSPKVKKMDKNEPLSALGFRMGMTEVELRAFAKESGFDFLRIEIPESIKDSNGYGLNQIRVKIPHQHNTLSKKGEEKEKLNQILIEVPYDIWSKQEDKLNYIPVDIPYDTLSKDELEQLQVWIGYKVLVTKREVEELDIGMDRFRLRLFCIVKYCERTTLFFNKGNLYLIAVSIMYKDVRSAKEASQMIDNVFTEKYGLGKKTNEFSFMGEYYPFSKDRVFKNYLISYSYRDCSDKYYYDKDMEDFQCGQLFIKYLNLDYKHLVGISTLKKEMLEGY